MQEGIQCRVVFGGGLIGLRLFSTCAAALLRAHGQEDLDWTSQQLLAVPEDGSAQDVTLKYQSRLSLAEPRACS